MRVKKFLNYRMMVKSKKTAAAATPMSKGGKKPVIEADPYVVEMKI